MKLSNAQNLYLVLTQKYRPDKSLTEIAKQSILGGADIVQIREKNIPEKRLIETGKELSAVCRKNNAAFIINDNPYITKAVDADGIHLGQEDLRKYPILQTRRIIGSGKIIGISTHCLKQFKRANKSSCDYLAYGPIFPTDTKNYHIGTKDIETVLNIAEKPVFFIGGIDLTNIDILLNKGAQNIAVIRSIMQAENITETTKRFKAKIRGIGYADKN